MTKEPNRQTNYTFTLLFPEQQSSTEVTQVSYQITSDVGTELLAKNKMPPFFKINDTLTFTYKKANPGVKIKSCLFTQFNVKSPTKETYKDAIDYFDKPITITEAFRGTWIFHLLGLYKSNDKQAAYYLDPEFTCGPI
ncbi:MAG: hypothetical protein IPK77_07290 [Cellvibrio sp.]|jgi:hypothetical protein|nr:hypothetical protein [Cellvibrio sp.]